MVGHDPLTVSKAAETAWSTRRMSVVDVLDAGRKA